MTRWMLIGALALAAACGGDDDGGGGSDAGGGTVTAQGMFDGTAIAVDQPCELNATEDEWSVRGAGGEPHRGIVLRWQFDAITGPGTYDVPDPAWIYLGLEISEGDLGYDVLNAYGTITFDTLAPEDGVVSGSFEGTIDEPVAEVTGAFDCK